MELHQLYYFVAVAETGGFSRAAERCNVAQPSLSQQIKKLEQELGQQLFDRLGRTVALTEAGQVLLPRARSILAEVEHIERRLSREIDEGYGQLAVGFIPTIAPFLLPNVIKRFAENFRFFGAPAAIFCFVDRVMGAPQWSDLGMFLQTFMLLAQEEGIDSCAQECWAAYPKTVSRFCGMGGEMMLFCGIALGYRDDSAPVNHLVTSRASTDEWLKVL